MPNPKPIFNTLSPEAFGWSRHNFCTVSRMISFSQPIITPISSPSTSRTHMCWSWTTLYLSFDLRNASKEPEAVSSVARRRRVEESVNGRVPSRPRRSSAISQQTMGVHVHFRSEMHLNGYLHLGSTNKFLCCWKIARYRRLYFSDSQLVHDVIHYSRS